MANELQPLSQLVQNKLFRIPDYQRGYAWQQPQLQNELCISVRWIFSTPIGSLIFLRGWLQPMIGCMRRWMWLASNTRGSIYRHGSDCLLFRAYI